MDDLVDADFIKKVRASVWLDIHLRVQRDPFWNSFVRFLAQRVVGLVTSSNIVEDEKEWAGVERRVRGLFSRSHEKSFNLFLNVQYTMIWLEASSRLLSALKINCDQFKRVYNECGIDARRVTEFDLLWFFYKFKTHTHMAWYQPTYHQRIKRVPAERMKATATALKKLREKEAKYKKLVVGFKKTLTEKQARIVAIQSFPNVGCCPKRHSLSNLRNRRTIGRPAFSILYWSPVCCPKTTPGLGIVELLCGVAVLCVLHRSLFCRIENQNTFIKTHIHAHVSQYFFRMRVFRVFRHYFI